MSRIIHVLARDGSPLGVTEKTIFDDGHQRGCGGAELALLTMCASWQAHGNDVTLYNNPRIPDASSFKQKNIDEFVLSEDRDILVIFRSPNPKVDGAKGKHIWWSCDPSTIGDFREFASHVDKIVTISPHHSEYFKVMYGITNSIPIDVPVRTWEYRDKVEKITHRCIYTSIPDRGVMALSKAWSKVIKEVPDVSLVITSDWRLWDGNATEDRLHPYRLAFAPLPNVSYVGAVNRKQLVEEQMKAELLTFPCTYDEMFCIAAAEAQVAGAIPITSDFGALPTTNMGIVIHGNPEDEGWRDIFVQNIVEQLTSPLLKERQEHIRDLAMKRFSPDRILGLWDEVFA